MAKHLVNDLDRLSKELLTMGAMVEEAINKTITALRGRRKDLAREVIAGDQAINALENRIEDDALKILALHQPVAEDLRFLITALKVNNDLERMGDLAANICERAEMLIDSEPIAVPESFTTLVENVHTMVHDSLNALVSRDAVLARSVIDLDDTVDEINRGMYDAMHKLMHENPQTIERAVATISVSRNMERIADLATNIAEDVIFMAAGDIVRHNL